MDHQTNLLLSGEFIIAETAPLTPLYQLNKPLDALTHKTTSIQFSRLDNTDAKLQDSSSSFCQPLYSLIHPSNAQYRTDIPASYFLTHTSPASSPTLGNIKLTPSSSPSLTRKYLLPFHKPSFTALLHPSSSSSSSPLFPASDEGLKILFTAKPSRGGKVWEWLDESRKMMAREEVRDRKKGEEPRLVIKGGWEGIGHERRDALIALWVLRLWWGAAEEREFQTEALMEMTPPESISYGGGSMAKMNKRMGALGGFAAAGGAC